ncbi:hypothetical protein AB0395_34795 [Streptosporangium sp. NPDC051023]
MTSLNLPISRGDEVHGECECGTPVTLCRGVTYETDGTLHHC